MQEFLARELKEKYKQDPDDEEVTCFRCNKSGFWGDPSTGNIRRWSAFSLALFKGRQYEKSLWQCYCVDCMKIIVPYAVALRDIDETKRHVNKLERTIREKIRAR